MLNDNYMKALKGLKAQAAGTPAFGVGLEFETQHIYRILMNEGVTVNDIDASMLEEFISNEVAGIADYSKPVDRDGLQYVDLDKSVDVYPCVGDSFLVQIPDENFRLSPSETSALLTQLTIAGKLTLITDTLQSLCVNLQTAMPQLSEVKTCISEGISFPRGLLDKFEQWEKMNCAVISFDFQEKK